MKERILTKLFGKTENGERYTFGQWLIYVWLALSLCILGMTADDAPLWWLGLWLASFAAAGHYLKKLPLPEDPEKDLYDDEEE